MICDSDAPELIPKLTPLALRNDSELVPVRVCVPAMTPCKPPGATDAVIVAPFSPKLTLLLLLNTTDAIPLLVVPAEKLTDPPPPAPPMMVMALPFWLRVMLLPPASSAVPVLMLL